MLVDSQSYLPVFPHYSCASKHDSHGFLHAFCKLYNKDVGIMADKNVVKPTSLLYNLH